MPHPDTPIPRSASFLLFVHAIGLRRGRGKVEERIEHVIDCYGPGSAGSALVFRELELTRNVADLGGWMPD